MDAPQVTEVTDHAARNPGAADLEETQTVALSSQSGVEMPLGYLESRLTEQVNIYLR